MWWMTNDTLNTFHSSSSVDLLAPGRPDIGYVQGMTYIACMIQLNIPDNFEQFVCFANIICSPFCLDIFHVEGDRLMGVCVCVCVCGWVGVCGWLCL